MLLYRLRLIFAGIMVTVILTTIVPSVALGSASYISSLAVADSDSSLKRIKSTELAFGRFLTAVEALYGAVNNGKLEESRENLMEVEQQFRNLPMKEIATAEGIQALAQSITDMKRATSAVQPNELKWRTGAAALRLAADALVHPDQPIWHQYRTLIQEDIERMSRTLNQNGHASSPIAESTLHAFDQLQEHYHMIRTAAMLQSEPWKIERSDSVVRYVSRIYHAVTPQAVHLQGTIRPLQEALYELFPDNNASSTTLVPPVGGAPPTWGWTAMMGTFIVTILTWVGWRRYKFKD